MTLTRLLLAYCLLSLSCAEHSSAQLKEPYYDINIPSLNAAEALNKLAEQTGAILLFPYTLAESRQTNAVLGRYTLTEALQLLLKDSGLSSGVSERRVIEISANEAGADEKGSEAMATQKRPVGKKIAAMLASALATSSALGQETANTDDGAVEEITVTGSRVARSGFDTPTPITLVGREDIENTGYTNIDDVLLRLPQVTIGLGAQNSFANGEAGAAFINLRGLGTNRSLVVIDGRRRVSGSSTQSAVDLNTIPAAMIERVELITGGASAVYGADAVTGVVNLITKRKFDGLEIAARSGISELGDAERYLFSVTAGTEFAEDRGFVNVAGTFSRSTQLAVNEREFSNFCMQTAVNPENTGPNDGIFDNITYRDTVVPILSATGSFEIGGIAYTYDPAVGARPFNNELDLHAFASIGTDGRCTTADQTIVRPEQETISMFSKFGYSVFDNTRLFVEADFSAIETVDPERWLFDLVGSIYPQGLILHRDNPLLPESVTDLMDAVGQTELVYNGTYYNHGRLSRFYDRDTYAIVTGVEGTIGERWDWNVFYQHGEFEDNITQINTRILSHFLSAVDVITDPVTGEPVCRSGDPDCVPIQIIGGGDLTSGQRDYAFYDKLQSVRNTQTIYGAQVTGDFIELPAGAIGMAFGAEYREETIRLREDKLYLLGDAFPAPPGFEPMDASLDVSEVYAEFVIPLLNDSFMSRQLDLELAARYSDYKTIGETMAWKGGVNWTPVDQLRIRSTLSRSVRAPNLNELFGPVNGVFTFTDDIDPCRPEGITANPQRTENCRSLGVPDDYNPDVGDGVFITLSGGNPDLSEETADTWTAGIIWTPELFRGISLSADYWNIEIEGAIGRLSAIQVLNRCVDSETIENIFCDQVTRGPDFFITGLNSRDLNIGSLTAAGVDFAGSYDFDAAGGSFGIELNATYLTEHERQVDATDPSSLDIALGEVENPEWRTNLAIRYSKGDFAGILNTRYFDSVKQDAQFSDEFLDSNEISSRTYHDLVLRYVYADSLEFVFGVNNILDTEPPHNNPEVYNGRRLGSNYDVLGRYFNVGVTVEF